MSRQHPPTVKGMTFLLLEGETGRLPISTTPPVYERFRASMRELGH